MHAGEGAMLTASAPRITFGVLFGQHGVSLYQDCPGKASKDTSPIGKRPYPLGPH
jgi:hypothetical protein